MNSKRTIIYNLIFFIVCCNAIIGQQKNGGTISRSFFKNGLVARELYTGADQMLDSIKTYHIVGGLDEKFYFTGNNQPNGLCQKFSNEGKLKTTWLYNKGVLIRRIDYFKEFNLKNKQTAESNYENIIKMNGLLQSHPDNFINLYSRAASQMYLEDNVLAELDFLAFKNRLESIKANTSDKDKGKFPTLNKDLAEIYSRLSGIYSRFENDNLNIDYHLKAIQTDPTETRHLYNLGSNFVTQVQDYRLGIYYLNEVVRKIPNHNFANWVLGYAYLELEQYQKALDCINIAFENEDNLYVYGYGNAESDLRTIRGLAYHKLGKTAIGIKDLNEALRINDKNSVANKYLGIVYEDLGEKGKACEYFQKSRTLGYEKKYYNKELESFIKRTCELNDAKTAVSKSVILSPKDLPYISPNPAEDFVEVFNYPYANFNFTIIDVNGKQIKSGMAADKIIPVSGLPSGLYILTVEQERKLETFKLIKK